MTAEETITAPSAAEATNPTIKVESEAADSTAPQAAAAVDDEPVFSEEAKTDGGAAVGVEVPQEQQQVQPLSMLNEDINDISSDPEEGKSDDARAKKRKERLEQNRISARESRKRKKTMIEELQRTVITLSRENKDLNDRNEQLRTQLMEIGTKYPNVVPIQAIMSGTPQAPPSVQVVQPHTATPTTPATVAQQQLQQQHQQAAAVAAAQATFNPLVYWQQQQQAAAMQQQPPAPMPIPTLPPAPAPDPVPAADPTR